MHSAIEFLMTYGYTVVFAAVLAEQLGVPLPATPVLLAAGGLAGLGKLNLPVAWLLAVSASLLGDSVWYYLGKTRGMPVLRLLCRISLEPDACVRRTNAVYSRHGSRWLLFAKFVPGVSTIAPPMAGIFRLSPLQFIAMDGAGAGLWAGVFMVAGWCCSGQIELIGAYADRVGGWAVWTAAAALAIYVSHQLIERRRLYRSLRVARIAPLELKRRMEAGEAIAILDLRNAFEWREARIPGSLTINDEQLDAFVPAAGESEMIVYCSCPDEISSIAGAAIRLRRRGVKLVRPLEGGFPLWTHLGLPVEVGSGASA